MALYAQAAAAGMSSKDSGVSNNEGGIEAGSMAAGTHKCAMPTDWSDLVSVEQAMHMAKLETRNGRRWKGGGDGDGDGGGAGTLKPPVQAAAAGVIAAAVAAALR